MAPKVPLIEKIRFAESLASTDRTPSAQRTIVYLRDVGGEAFDGEYDECWVVCSKGDPGAVAFVPA